MNGDERPRQRRSAVPLVAASLAEIIAFIMLG